jgi:hypothetical protein
MQSSENLKEFKLDVIPYPNRVELTGEIVVFEQISATYLDNYRVESKEPIVFLLLFLFLTF